MTSDLYPPDIILSSPNIWVHAIYLWVVADIVQGSSPAADTIKYVAQSPAQHVKYKTCLAGHMIHAEIPRTAMNTAGDLGIIHMHFSW